MTTRSFHHPLRSLRGSVATLGFFLVLTAAGMLACTDPPTLPTDREQSIALLQADLKKLESEMDAWRARVDALPPTQTASAETKATLAGLDSRRADVKRALETLRNLEEPTWEEQEKRYRSAWDELNAAFKDAKAKVSDKP